MPRSTRLGVLGWPVAHSLSPALHNAALEAVGLSGWRYQLLPVPPELLAETVRALPEAGFRGANVTSVNDVLGSAQGLECLGTKQTMRVGNDANEDGGSQSLGFSS